MYRIGMPRNDDDDDDDFDDPQHFYDPSNHGH